MEIKLVTMFALPRVSRCLSERSRLFIYFLPKIFMLEDTNITKFISQMNWARGKNQRVHYKHKSNEFYS